MLQPGGDPDLPAEAVGADGGAEVGVEQLEGDGRSLAVVREVHGRHAAAPELALDGVTAGEGGLELRAEIGLHGSLSPSTSFWNRGCFRSGSNVGSIRSHPGER